MIRHFVLLKFRPDVTETEKRTLFDALADLRSCIPGILDFRAGPNVSVETDLVRGNLHGFYFDLVDAAARDDYLADENHRAVGARLVAAAEGGLDGITVFDLEV